MTHDFDHLIQDAYQLERQTLLHCAAALIAGEVSGRPELDGTDVAREYEELRHGNEPRDYFDDMEARVGLRSIDTARVYWCVATMPTDYFEDAWYSAAARYAMPPGVR